MSTSPRDIVRVGGGAAMAFAGVSHLTFARKGFQAQVPPWVPLDEDFVVLASGVVEFGLGTSFALLPQHRRTIGAVLAGFFVAIFPGNIAQYRHSRDSLGLDSDRKRFVRLFFQPVMVAAALYGGGYGDKSSSGLRARLPGRRG